jgi:hypothetical protein
MVPRFLPSARVFNWLISIGFLALGYALYLRYLVLEQPIVGQACDAGLDTWLCLIRKVVSALYLHMVFGWIALGASILNLIRPSVPLFVIALVATDFGIVLHNVGLSALAGALLVMSFARPVIAQE